MSVFHKPARTSTFLTLRESRFQTPISFSDVKDCNFPVSVRGNDPNESSATLYFPHFEELSTVLNYLCRNLIFKSSFRIVGNNWKLSPNGQFAEMGVNDFPNRQFFWGSPDFTITNLSHHIFPLRHGASQDDATQQAMGILGIPPSGFFFEVNTPHLYANLKGAFTYPVVFVIPSGPITSHQDVVNAARGIRPGRGPNYNLENMFVYELLDVLSAIFSHPECLQRHYVVPYGRRYGIQDITPVCIGTGAEALNKYIYTFRLLSSLSNGSPVFRDPTLIFFGSHHMLVPVTNTTYLNNRQHAVALNQDHGMQLAPFAPHEWTHMVPFTTIQHDYSPPLENFDTLIERFRDYLVREWHFMPGDVVVGLPHIQVRDSIYLDALLRLRVENSPRYNTFIQSVSEIFHTPMALMEKDHSVSVPFVPPIQVLPVDYVMMRSAI
jgi:hypothetical protein